VSPVPRYRQGKPAGELRRLSLASVITTPEVFVGRQDREELKQAVPCVYVGQISLHRQWPFQGQPDPMSFA